MGKVVLVGRLVVVLWLLEMAEQSDSRSFEELLGLEGTVDEPEVGRKLVRLGDRAVLVGKVDPGDMEHRVVAELAGELGDRSAELVPGLVVVLVIPSELF